MATVDTDSKNPEETNTTATPTEKTETTSATDTVTDTVTATTTDATAIATTTPDTAIATTTSAIATTTPATAIATTTPDTATATTTPDTATATTTPATAADAAAYYQQYGYSYGYYPYNYGYDYNQYNQQYYQQYYQQQQQMAGTTDNTTTTQTDTTQTTDTNTTSKSQNNTSESTTKQSTNDDENDNDNETTNTDNDTTISNTKNLIDWTHCEVSEWVQTVQSGQFADYAPRFIKNEIDGKVLYNITPQQLEMGLYINKMMDRLTMYELIQKLKQNTNANNNSINPPYSDDGNNTMVTNIENSEMNQQAKIRLVTELQKAPPIKKKKKKKNKKKVNIDKGNDNKRNISAMSTAAFLKLSVKHTMQNNKSSSQLLMDKMNNKNKRTLGEMNTENNNGIQYKIEWKYKENDKYNDMIIGLKDSVLFQWEYTRNIWKFVNKEAFNENNFDMNVAEELCGCDCNKFIWKPKKTGTYYFGCQVANCALSGNMKIKINVVENNRDGNPNKKQKIK